MEENKKAEQSDIEAILHILDQFAAGDESRMKLDVSYEQTEGSVSKVHHHGRCDIGSPWARGDCYDLPESD